MNLPAFAGIEDLAGTGDKREFSRDAHSPANIGLLVNYMASSFVGSRDGYGVTPMIDRTEVVTAHTQSLANPHA
jgi:hypothetical protein